MRNICLQTHKNNRIYYYFCMNLNIWEGFQIWISVPLKNDYRYTMSSNKYTFIWVNYILVSVYYSCLLLCTLVHLWTWYSVFGISKILSNFMQCLTFTAFLTGIQRLDSKMNPLIQNCSRKEKFKLLSRRLALESSDVFVRGSPFFA